MASESIIYITYEWIKRYLDDFNDNFDGYKSENGTMYDFSIDFILNVLWILHALFILFVYWQIILYLKRWCYLYHFMPINVHIVLTICSMILYQLYSNNWILFVHCILYRFYHCCTRFMWYLFINCNWFHIW